MMYENPDSRETPGLEDYLRAIRSHWRLVLGVLLLFIALAYLLVSTRQSSWQGEARVLVNPAPIARTSQTNLPPVNLERESGVLKSVRTAAAAAEELGIGVSANALLEDVEVQFEPGSDIVSVFVVRQDHGLATDTANALARAYVELRNADAAEVDALVVAELTAQIDQLTERDEVLREERDVVSRNLNRAEGAEITALSSQLTAITSELSQLQVELRTVRAGLTGVVREQQTRGVAAEVLELEDDAEFNGIGDVTVYAAAVLAGLILGVSAAWLSDRLDRTARGSGDVELAVGAMVLGMIPDFGIRNRTGPAAIVMLSNSKSARVQRSREAFRRLRSSVQFLSQSSGNKTFVVTSARPGEGKSVTITNLAVAMAQSGADVVLVSADMRRPTVERLLGLQNPELGLSSFLGGSERHDIALRVNDVSGLTVIPAGALPTNPGELLASERFGEVITDLADSFDYVFVDAPPVLSAADSMAAASHCDGVFVVVDGQRTQSDALLRVGDEIRRAGGSVAGAILNRDRADDESIFKRDRYAYERVTVKTGAK